MKKTHWIMAALAGMALISRADADTVVLNGPGVSGSLMLTVPTTGMDYGGYGVGVATFAETLDYVGGGVVTPEPSTWAMKVLGFAGYRKSRQAKSVAA
jgi:hypothetical protein